MVIGRTAKKVVKPAQSCGLLTVRDWADFVAEQTVDNVCRRSIWQSAPPKNIGIFTYCLGGLFFAHLHGQGPWRALPTNS
jgi:hypothetical protein